VCDGRELDYVREVLESGWLTTAGKALEFEQRFAGSVGAPYACAVNSCTAALHLAMEAIGIGPGDKVLIPTWTFTATAEVVRYLGADPVLLDVDYRTSLLTPALVEAALAKHHDAKALMVVHFGGQAATLTTADERGILDLCRARGVKVIEDAAHAFPSRREGKMVGREGDLTCFSFYANKTITTGEGGMLTTHDEALWRRCKVMRLHGIDRDVWKRFTSDKPSWEYDVIAPGYKYNMPDINAAVGLAQLERAETLRQGRQRCAEHYYKQLAGLPSLDLPGLDVPLEDHAWHIFAVVLTEEAPVDRGRLIELMAEKGIGTSVHYKPIHRMSYYRERYNLDPLDYPNAERLWRGCMSLPIYPSLSCEELWYVTDTLKELLRTPGDASVAGFRSSDRVDAFGDVSVGTEIKARIIGSPSERRAAKIHLSVPHVGGNEERYVREAFASNWLSTVGPNLVSLEQEMHRRLGQPAVALANGTAAIQLALRLAGVGPGDEVISPTLTFVASCNPIRYLGAIPLFVDSESQTWNLDPNRLAEVLAMRAARGRLPKALVAVHLFGQMADMDPIIQLCQRYGIALVEDAAESLGAFYKGRPSGTLGDVSVLSFNGNKVITATAGGMLSSKRPEWVEKARFWSTQACDPNPDRNYLHSELGYNYRMSNVLAGIALGQLEVLDLRVQQRRAVFERYRAGFADIRGIEPQPEAEFGDGRSEMEDGGGAGRGARGDEQSAKSKGPSTEPEGAALGASHSALSSLHTRWLSCFLIDEAEFGMSSADLIRFLDAANIESRPVWKPMHTQPLYRGYECIGGEVAEDLNRRGICLPSSSSLSEEDQQFVIERVREAHSRGKR